MANNEKKTRYSDEELEEFKALIEGKLKEGREQLDFYLAQLSEGGNRDTKVKGLDDGVGTAEKERLSNMAIRQKKYIQYLQNALLRLSLIHI